ncbi:MAG: ferredoxin--NADP reductase [Pseudohongiellaceae bacterium]|nr:ferredoxin--NADP reductase [Pseudohongiellaceae bacterium]
MTQAQDQWLKATVVSKVHRTNNLFSLRLDAPIADFKAGQYISIGLKVDGNLIEQPYSILSAPGQSPLEFFLYTNLDGELSSLLGELQPGDHATVKAQAEGGFTLDAVPSCKDLWLLATGTGVAPFLSILQQGDVWKRFERIVLVYAVRLWEDLGYEPLIQQWLTEHPEQFKFVPFVSREKVDNTIHGHIPASLSNGSLERMAGIELSHDDSQLMLCGNPGMVQDAVAVLEEKGFTLNGPEQKGHITHESYW